MTAIIQGARKEEARYAIPRLLYFFLELNFIFIHSQEVRLAAMNALINALDFIKQNFERQVYKITERVIRKRTV